MARGWSAASSASKSTGRRIGGLSGHGPGGEVAGLESVGEDQAGDVVDAQVVDVLLTVEGSGVGQVDGVIEGSLAASPRMLLPMASTLTWTLTWRPSFTSRPGLVARSRGSARKGSSGISSGPSSIGDSAVAGTTIIVARSQAAASNLEGAFKARLAPVIRDASGRVNRALNGGQEVVEETLHSPQIDYLLIVLCLGFVDVTLWIMLLLQFGLCLANLFL